MCRCWLGGAAWRVEKFYLRLPGNTVAMDGKII